MSPVVTWSHTHHLLIVSCEDLKSLNNYKGALCQVSPGPLSGRKIEQGCFCESCTWGCNFSICLSFSDISNSTVTGSIGKDAAFRPLFQWDQLCTSALTTSLPLSNFLNGLNTLYVGVFGCSGCLGTNTHLKNNRMTHST